jgi:hypothetical protein
MKSDQADFIRISNFLAIGSTGSLSRLQLLLHHGLQVGKSAPICYLSVDQDGRNPPDADSSPLVGVARHEVLNGRGIHVLGQFLHVEAKPSGNLVDLLVIENVVVFEKPFMELPELSLPFRGKRSLGGFHRKSVALERKILVNELNVFRILLQQLMECRLEPRAIWSLVSAEHDERDRRILRSFEGQTGEVELMDVLELENLKGL